MRVPKTQVIRQVRLNAHFRPIMSTRRPKKKAPTVKPKRQRNVVQTLVLVEVAERSGLPVLIAVKIRPLSFVKSTFIS